MSKYMIFCIFTEGICTCILNFYAQEREFHHHRRALPSSSLAGDGEKGPMRIFQSCKLNSTSSPFPCLRGSLLLLQQGSFVFISLSITCLALLLCLRDLWQDVLPGNWQLLVREGLPLSHTNSPILKRIAAFCNSGFFCYKIALNPLFL